MLDFTPGFAGLVPCVEQPPGVWTYQTAAAEFALWRLESSGAATTVPGAGSGRVLLVTDGTVNVGSRQQDLALSRGQAVFVTPDEDDAQVEGDGVVFVAGPGVR